MEFKEISLAYKDEIVSLASDVNPSINIEDLHARLMEMFSYDSYMCF